MSTVMTDNEVREHIGRNLSAILEEREISRSHLARVTGEDVMTISRTARGLNLPSAATLARIAEALDTTSEALMAPPARPKKSSRKSA